MLIQVIDNVTRSMASVLSRSVERAEDIRMAVAFVSRRGLSMIEEPLTTALNKGASIEFLVGLDMHSTEPIALRWLYNLSHQTDHVALYCYADLAPASVYHPKLYLMRSGDSITAVVGSSNLTEGGLQRNIEINLAVEGVITEETVTDLYGTYNSLKFHPQRVVPDEEFLDLYQALSEHEKRQRRSDKSRKNLQNAFVEKARTLQRPAPTTKDLIGWLRLVYDALPTGEFTNKQIYLYEPVFQQHYPENRNIRAKIRQQLQILNSMGLIEHLDKARWRKV